MTEGDILTVEIEHVDAAAVRWVRENRDVDVEPTPETLAIIQDKFAQKRHFEQKGVAVTDYLEVKDDADAEKAATTLGFPFMLKAKRYIELLLLLPNRMRNIKHAECILATRVPSRAQGIAMRSTALKYYRTW